MRTFAIGIVLFLGLSFVASAQNNPRFVAKLALKSQTKDIPVTTLFTPKADGLYRVSTYLVVAVPGGNDNSYWLGQVLYTDDAGPETGPGELVDSVRQGGFPSYGESQSTIRANAGIPVSYRVTGQDTGAAGVYEFYVTVEGLE